MAHRWERSYSPGVSWGEPLVSQPIESVLHATAVKWPEAAALDFENNIFTFAALRDLAARAAKGFQDLGVGPGVHVALLLPNCQQFIVSFFGALMAGARVVILSPLAPQHELEAQLADSGARLLVTVDPKARRWKGIATLGAVIVCDLEPFPLEPPNRSGEGSCDDPLSIAETVVAFSTILSNAGDYTVHPRGRLDEDVAVLQYTGGTTGEPKAAMLTHRNFSTVPHVFGRWVGNLMDETSSVLVVLPLFHVFGLVVVLLSIAVGAKIVLHRKFEVERTLSDIERKKVTVFFGVPTIYSAIVRHAGIEDRDLSSLRLCGAGGAPLRTDILWRFKDLTGLTILEGYSLTEITDVGTWQPLFGAKPGTVGVPLPLTVVEIVDLATGMEVLPTGHKGEICFSGPQLMTAYWKNPQATAEAFRGGRFHTGDIGFMDEDGYITLVDRKKEMILCGGHNVFPRKIEETILQHAAVAEVAVVGIPDPYLGEIPKAFVVLRSGCQSFSETGLQAFLADKLAYYEIPKRLEVRRNLPKSAAGKVLKRSLLASEEDRGGRSSVSEA